MADLPDLSKREVVIGAGVHGQIYAATRVAMGFPKPVVLEREQMAGGIYMRYAAVPFYLNSVNRGSLSSTAKGPTRIRSLTPADDINYFPNCASQIGAECDTEYPSSLLVAQVVRQNHGRYSEVYPGCDVTVTDPFRARPRISVNGETPVETGRLIDARGLRCKAVSGAKPYTSLVTADDYLRNQVPPAMTDGTPRRVAIVGDGDTARIGAESLLGQGPRGMRVNVAEIGWYGPRLPLTKKQWFEQVQARYLGLARHFPQADVTGMITPYPVRGIPAPLGNQVRVGTQSYDLAICCTGYEPAFKSAVESSPANFSTGAGLWRSAGGYYIIGTAAAISYQPYETGDGNNYTRFPANVASILRLGPATAQLAASLPAVAGA